MISKSNETQIHKHKIIELLQIYTIILNSESFYKIFIATNARNEGFGVFVRFAVSRGVLWRVKNAVQLPGRCGFMPVLRRFWA